MQKLKIHLLRTQSSKVFPLKHGVGQNTAKHVLPTTKDFFSILVSTLPAHSPAFFKNISPLFPVLAVANIGSCVGSQDKIGHPAGRSR